MNKEYNEVKEFHKAFNHPYSDTPIFLGYMSQSRKFNA